MSEMKRLQAEHCEHCAPDCSNCAKESTCTLPTPYCDEWECGRDEDLCFEDAVSAEADRRNDAAKEDAL